MADSNPVLCEKNNNACNLYTYLNMCIHISVHTHINAILLFINAMSPFAALILFLLGVPWRNSASLTSAAQRPEASLYSSLQVESADRHQTIFLLLRKCIFVPIRNV